MQAKIITMNGAIYQARAIDPDEAKFIAKANGLLSPETFTIRHNDQVLMLNHRGEIVKPYEASPKTSIKVIVKSNLIYEIRVIPPLMATEIAVANNCKDVEEFVTKYPYHTLVIDDSCTVVRNQTAEIRQSKILTN